MEDYEIIIHNGAKTLVFDCNLYHLARDNKSEKTYYWKCKGFYNKCPASVTIGYDGVVKRFSDDELHDEYHQPTTYQEIECIKTEFRILQRAQTDVNTCLKAIYDQEVMKLTNKIGMDSIAFHMKKFTSMQSNMKKKRKLNTSSITNTSDDLILKRQNTGKILNMN